MTDVQKKKLKIKEKKKDYTIRVFKIFFMTKFIF